MRLLRDLPIKNKLRIINLFSSALILSLVATAFISYDLVTSRQKMEQDLYILARVVGMNSNAGLIFDDPSMIQENVATLKANPNIMLGRIFKENGESVAHYYREELTALEQQQIFLSKLSYFFLQSTQSFPTSIEYDPTREYAFFHDDYVDIYLPIILNEKFRGTIFIRSDLQALKARLQWALIIVISVLVIAMFISNILTAFFQRSITLPLSNLLQTMNKVSHEKIYSLREKKESNDEIGMLVDGFNQMLTTIELREQELALANTEITGLNERLKAENLRMGAELEITRRLQTMILPRDQELANIADLEIAGIMEPADEVGGDYYDVLQHEGRVKIGIGDVTGHGLESGVLMLMVQMAVRTLLINDVKDTRQFLNVLNRAVFENVKRMGTDKNLTLSLLDYDQGYLRFTGQHEELLVVNKNGEVRRIDTLDLGFMIGIEADIEHLVHEQEIFLQPNEGVVLYTDGITEARNPNKEMYGIERLCAVISKNWHLDSVGIREAILIDLHHHIDYQKIADDITLVVLKRRE
jgi:serine phosphatase RsbU (regulator of sigma subunit)